MWNQNLNEVSMISIFVYANVLALLWAPNMSGLNNSIGPIAWNCPKWRWTTVFVGRSCRPKLPAKLVFWNFGQQMLSHALLILRGVSNEDNTTFIIVVIFFRGCVPEVVVPSCAVGFLHIPKNLGFEYSIAVQAYDVCIYSSTLWPDGGIRVFAHQITLLSSLCRPIWRYWTCQVTVSSVCLRFNSHSYLSCNTWGCAYLAHPFLS